MFQQQRIPDDEIGGEHPHHLVEGEIPGFHCHDHAPCLFQDIGFAGRGFHRFPGQESIGLVRIIFSDGSTEFHFSLGFHKQFPHVFGHGFRIPVQIPPEQGSHLAQDRFPVLHVIVFLPGLVLSIGPFQGFFHPGIGQALIGAEHFIGIGINSLISHNRPSLDWLNVFLSFTVKRIIRYRP